MSATLSEAVAANANNGRQVLTSDQARRGASTALAASSQGAVLEQPGTIDGDNARAALHPSQLAGAAKGESRQDAPTGSLALKPLSRVPTSNGSLDALAIDRSRPERMERPPQPLLRRAAASEYLWRVWGIKRAPATLAKLACIGGGPKFRRAGRWPMYGEGELDDYARELLGELVESTSVPFRG